MTKNKKLLALVIGVLFCSVQTANAGCDGFYLAGRGGVARYSVDSKSKGPVNDAANYVVDKDRFMASGALGYRYKHVRGELEYVWRRKNTETVLGMNKARYNLILICLLFTTTSSRTLGLRRLLMPVLVILVISLIIQTKSMVLTTPIKITILPGLWVPVFLLNLPPDGTLMPDIVIMTWAISNSATVKPMLMTKNFIWV